VGHDRAETRGTGSFEMMGLLISPTEGERVGRVIPGAEVAARTMGDVAGHKPFGVARVGG
jgi:hypothetical protein